MYNAKNTGFFGLAQSYCVKNGTLPSPKSLTKAMSQINQASKKIADENNIPFVDIESQVPKTTEYFYDDVHYTTKGNALVANIIYKAIVQNRFLD
jgi:hypothetical protein